MKKILFMLIFLIAGNVSAKEQYTDYEFIDYVEEAKENDELNKYEPVLLNQFYKLEESDFDYLENDWNGDYEFRNTEDYKTEKFFSQQNLSYNRIGKITAETTYNYLLNPIKITNIKNYQMVDIREIEVYNDQKIVSTEISEYPELKDGDKTAKVQLNGSSITIKLLPYNYYIGSIRIVIYYGDNTQVDFKLTIGKQSGLYELQKHITLDNKVNSTAIDFMIAKNFNDLVNSNNLTANSDNVIYYYEYEKRLYRHYNLEKKYYIMSELTSLDDYIYDIDESITMYKHYQREKYNVPDEENIQTEVDTTPPSTEVKNEDENEVETTPPSAESQDGEDVQNLADTAPPTTEAKEDIVEETKISSPVSFQKKTPKKTKSSMKETDDYDEPDLVVDSNNTEEDINTDAKETQNFTQQENITETCDNNDKPSFWFILSIIFIIISIICDYLHYRRVKSTKEL